MTDAFLISDYHHITLHHVKEMEKLNETVQFGFTCIKKNEDLQQPKASVLCETAFSMM